MANFLTYDGNYCRHEGLDGCRTIDEYKKKLGTDGDSCTGLMYFDIEKMFPDAPKLIIERDFEESVSAIQRHFSISREVIGDMKSRLDKVDGLRIRFKEINSNLEIMWSHLIGTPCNMKRGEMLAKMNIQVVDMFDYDVPAALELMEVASCRG